MYLKGQLVIGVVEKMSLVVFCPFKVLIAQEFRFSICKCVI